MMYRHIFDLDNTLIYTDRLNNISYNYALNAIGLAVIDSHSRITRDTVDLYYPSLSLLDRKRIIELKQKYFIDNISDTEANISLITFLKTLPADSNVLWTSADQIRVNSLLNFYDMSNCFCNILFSRKDNIAKDINEICKLFDE